MPRERESSRRDVKNFSEEELRAVLDLPFLGKGGPKANRHVLTIWRKGVKRGFGVRRQSVIDELHRRGLSEQPSQDKIIADLLRGRLASPVPVRAGR